MEIETFAMLFFLITTMKMNDNHKYNSSLKKVCEIKINKRNRERKKNGLFAKRKKNYTAEASGYTRGPLHRIDLNPRQKK